MTTGVLADDHSVVRDGLRVILARFCYLAGLGA